MKLGLCPASRFDWIIWKLLFFTEILSVHEKNGEKCVPFKIEMKVLEKQSISKVSSLLDGKSGLCPTFKLESINLEGKNRAFF